MAWAAPFRVNRCVLNWKQQPFPKAETVGIIYCQYPFQAVREYEATVWARVNETLAFHVHFEAGSHVRVGWTIVYPDDVWQNCSTQDTHPVSGTNAPTTYVNSVTHDQTLAECVFPFR